MDRAPKQRDKSRRAEMVFNIAGGMLETERENRRGSSNWRGLRQRQGVKRNNYELGRAFAFPERMW